MVIGWSRYLNAVKSHHFHATNPSIFCFEIGARDLVVICIFTSGKTHEIFPHLLTSADSLLVDLHTHKTHAHTNAHKYTPNTHAHILHEYACPYTRLLAAEENI